MLFAAIFFSRNQNNNNNNKSSPHFALRLARPFPLRLPGIKSVSVLDRSGRSELPGAKKEGRRAHGGARVGIVDGGVILNRSDSDQPGGK